jgi:hypothetical protein
MKRKQAKPNQCYHCDKPVAAHQPGSIRWDYKGSPVYCNRGCYDARRAEQSYQRLWCTAVHEAGHCLGARLGGRKIKEATIVPSKKFEGCVSHEIDIHQPYPTEYQMEEWLLGHAAEVEFGFTGGIGHEYDYEQAAELLKAPIKRAKSLAWSERTDIWGSTLNHITNEYEEHPVYSTWDIRPRYSYVNGKTVNHVKDWQKSVRVTKAEWQPEFDKYVRKARRLAKKYRAWMERVAKLLLEKRTLTDREVPPL